MEQYDTFTLSAFPEDYRDAMLLLGTRSGRDGDKIRESGLTPIASAQVAAPGFAEAELILECRKVYWADMDAAHFLDSSIEGNYPHGDYHRIYFGQIVAIARKLLVVVWHVLTEREADRRADPDMVAFKLLLWSWKLGKEHRGGLTTPQFVRAGLMRLEMGEDLPHIIRGGTVRQIASVEEVQALQTDIAA